MSNTKDISVKENKIKELENKIDRIKAKYYWSLFLIIISVIAWHIVLATADSQFYNGLVAWGTLLGLTFGTLVAFYLLWIVYKFLKILFTPEPDAPLVPEEELEKDEWEKVRLTACPNCMLVYDSRKSKCPECGNKTVLTKPKIVEE